MEKDNHNSGDSNSNPQESSRGSAFNRTNITATQKLIDDSLKTIITSQSQLITLQLDDSNFMLWIFQIEAAIKGYGLEHFIHKNCVAPQEFITDNDNQTTPNPEFLIHKRQDHILSSWLLLAINPNLLSQVIGCSSSSEIWHTIQQTFQSQSSAKILH